MRPVDIVACLALIAAPIEPQVSAAREVSSQNILDPSPFLPSDELVLTDWRVISRVSIGGGIDEIVVAPTVLNSNLGQFTGVVIELTRVPAGVEIVDEMLEIGDPGSREPVLTPEASLEVSDGITLRGTADSFAPEPNFLASLSTESFGWTVTARELPVLADGVIVVEHLQPSGEPPEGEAWEFLIPNAGFTANVTDQGTSALRDAAITMAETYLSNLVTDSNGEPVLDNIFISDPALRPPSNQGIYPPEEWFPNDAIIGGWYGREELLPGDRISYQIYFKVTFNLLDLGPLFVDPNAFAKTGTFVGAFGTPEPPFGPPDTLGDTQGDPLSLGTGDVGLTEPQYWSVRNKELTKGVFFSGQMGMSGLSARTLLRLREGQNPYIEMDVKTSYGASFRVRAEREFNIDEETFLLSPEEPIPLAEFPIGPIECRLTLAPSLFMGAGGELSGSAIAGWSENMTSILSVVIENGKSTVDLTHQRTPHHRTGPFLKAETHGQFDAFARARLSLDLTFNNLAGLSAIGSADAVARLTVDSQQDPWWMLESGSRSDVCFNANIIGIILAEKCIDLGELLEPHIQALAGPDPRGRPNAADQHWAKAVTYPSYNVFHDADIVPLSDGGLLMGVQYDINTILLLGLDAGGNEVWRKSLGNVIPTFSALRALPDGGALVQAEELLIRLDLDHEVSWAKTITPPSLATLLSVEGIEVAPDEFDFCIYFGGEIRGGDYPTPQAYVGKLDSNGEVVWVNTYALEGAEFFQDLAVMPDGGVVAAGKTDAPWEDTRDPSISEAFPDDRFNSYLARINSDGTARWAKAAVPDTFNTLVVNPSGRIGAVSQNHGLTDPWRGPGLHVFAADGEFLWASSYAIDNAEEDIELGDTLGDGVVSVTTAPGEGFLIASRTGVFPESTSASHLMALDGNGNPRWAILFDWQDSPSELPVRVIDRGDSSLLLSALDDARVNGGDPIDTLFLTCVPDSGLLELLSANRLDHHNFYKPSVDNFTGKGVLNQLVSGLPKSYTPGVVGIAGVVMEPYSFNITSPNVDPMFISMSDSAPSEAAPIVETSEGPNPDSITVLWPAEPTGYSVFESTDLEDWLLSPQPPIRVGTNLVIEPLIADSPKKFFRLEQTSPNE